jgi:hypothetical protein
MEYALETKKIKRVVYSALLCQLLYRLDFKVRIKGVHHILTKRDIDESLTYNQKKERQNLTRPSRYVIL